MDALDAFFGRNGLLPHGVCITGSPGLLWAMVATDALVAAAYFSIPLTLLRYVRQRPQMSQRWLALLFAAFIFACGTTHLMDIWTLWQPDYGWQVVSKGITAVISIVTAIVLWHQVPNALRLPSLGQLQALIGTLEAEVGRRRSAEQHIQDLEQNLAVTLTSIDAGFIASDADGRVTRMNAVAERITGWPQADALGQSLWQVFDRDDRPAVYLEKSPVAVMIEQGVTVADTHQVVAVGRNGHRTAVEVRAALTYADGGSVRGLAMVFRDMTALQAAESENHRLAAIVASSHDAIIGKTLDGRITSWNHSAEVLFGYSAAQIIGQPVQRLIPPEHAAEEMRVLADLARGKTVPPFETVRLARDGSRLAVSVTISPIRDETGRIVGASKIARDIRSQLQAEQSRLKAEQLESENRQVLEANRLKSLFLANMSHELRTPLNAIIGFAELMQAGAVPVDSPKHHQFLGHIASSGHHLLQLINDVLDLSKVESGKFEFHPEPIDLPQLVQASLDVLHTAIQRKHLTLATEIDPQLTGLVLDPARLKQVLFNYLSNAIKFTPERGRVLLRASPAGPLHFRIEVEDSGIGIAPADLPRLFSEFQQLDTGHNKQHAGTGLGLALTRRLVAAQGGSTGVRSQLGVGSIFDLLLPRQPQPLSLRPPASASHWLVIEDDTSQGARLVQALATQGITADTAGTAAAALLHHQQRLYDGITLDLQLPDQAGLTTLADLRRQAPGRPAPVLAMTMAAEPGLNATFVIADVLRKPLQTQEVVRAIQGLGPMPQRALRALVIDDDAPAVALMTHTLEGLGLQEVGALDARLALQQIDQHRPDLIVLDLMMPGLDGFATLDALRQMPRWRDTPVFIWTSMMLSDTEYALLARSARAILHKGGGALSDLVDALCRKQPARVTTPHRDGSEAAL